MQSHSSHLALALPSAARHRAHILCQPISAGGIAARRASSARRHWRLSSSGAGGRGDAQASERLSRRRRGRAHMPPTLNVRVVRAPVCAPPGVMSLHTGSMHARLHARSSACTSACTIQFCMDPTLRAIRFLSRRAPEHDAVSLKRQLIEFKYDEALSSAGGLLRSAPGESNVSVEHAEKRTHRASARLAYGGEVCTRWCERSSASKALPPALHSRASAPGANTRHTIALTGLRVSHRVVCRALRFPMITQLLLCAPFNLLAVRLHFACARSACAACR